MEESEVYLITSVEDAMRCDAVGWLVVVVEYRLGAVGQLQTAASHSVLR